MTKDEELDERGLKELPSDFFAESAEVVAKKLIGTFLIIDHEKAGRAGGRIVETEAYDQNDPAAHCFGKDERTKRKDADAMFLAGGHAYVFSTYCLNFVCDDVGFGAGVLIRALKPLVGKNIIYARQIPWAGKNNSECHDDEWVCRGPQHLGIALGVGPKLNRKSLYQMPFQLSQRQQKPKLGCGPRVGMKEYFKKNPINISEKRRNDAIEREWRFVDLDSLCYLSRKEREYRLTEISSS